jgi:hypothetical protein
MIRLHLSLDKYTIYHSNFSCFIRDTQIHPIFFRFPDRNSIAEKSSIKEMAQWESIPKKIDNKIAMGLKGTH